MLKNLSFMLVVTALLMSCAKNEENLVLDIRQDAPISVEEISKTIRTSIETNGVYHWSTASDELLWSAGMQSDSTFALGYQPENFSNIEERMHQVDINQSEWLAAKNKVLNLILEGEQEFFPNLKVEDLLPFGQPEVLPTLAVRITNANTIARLRSLDEVRYLESMGYELDVINQVERSDSGCGGANPDYNLNASDYQTISPNVKQSWHQDHSNVPQAWGTTTGAGVTITVIDTGASFNQNNLGSQFNSGDSQGRSVEKMSTHYSGSWWWRSLDSPDDQCGHGTQMSGLATAPRGSDGNSVGVAYNSNLIAVRAVNDVIISSSNEKNGVKNALIIAGNRSDVKVVSMSIGSPFWSGTVADGIYYAHNQGKMVVAAAGTSLSWTSWYGVIFPASMSQTVAVTGVKDSANMVKCDVCHSGSQVDFVMVMERASNNDRHALSLAEYSNQPGYVGGSSAATASVAGIAALIWSTDLSASRQDVFDAMKENASFYPSSNSNFGWGIIDANAAVNSPL